MKCTCLFRLHTARWDFHQKQISIISYDHLYQNYYSFLRKIAKATPFLISTLPVQEMWEKLFFPHHTELFRCRPHTWDQGHFHKVLGQSLLKTQISLEMMTYNWLSLAPNANKDHFFIPKNIPAKYLKLISKTPKGIFFSKNLFNYCRKVLPRILSPRKCCCSLHWLWKWGIASGMEWNRMTSLNFSQFLIKKDDVS